MRKWVMGFAGACAALLPAPGWSGPVAQNEELEAVRLAADRIEQDYVDAGAAPLVASALRKRAQELKAHGEQGDALADDLTRLLQSVSHDPHFRFGYSAEVMPADIFAPKAAEDAEAAAKRKARINNFGVLRAERLPGNIGFLDLDQFTDPAWMRRPLAAAMELLEHCDALIVDVRFNGGGYARGAALTASYFLPETPQRLLVRLESRDASQAVEIRTEGPLEGARFLDRPVFILTGAQTFSAAEQFAASMQQAGRAKIVGVRTRGGGNPSERVRLTPHYGMVLPTSRGLLPGGGSWEGVGVQPDIAVDEKDALIAAQRAALTGLLERNPKDLLAENWRQRLAGLSSAPATPAAPKNGAAR